jgi:hypothetical protein
MRHQSLLVLAAATGSLVAAAAPASAQAPPSVEKRTATTHPATPPGWKQTCIQGPDTGAPSPDCPVLVFGDYTYWVWSDANNDVRMAIVAYDAAGKAVREWVKPGARYIWQITRDESKQTIGFVGQANATITMTWDELAIAPPIPNALKVVDVNATSLACLFAPQCTVAVTDTTGDIPMPPGVSGTGRLQSRTFAGAPGTPGTGKTAYEYRVDLSQAVSTGEAPCVTDLTVDFGPVTQLDYGGGQPADVLVVNQGGLGTVGLFDTVKIGNRVTFTFNQPICAGAAAGRGLSSFFIGASSTTAPKDVTANVGWPGLDGLNVPARAPTY